MKREDVDALLDRVQAMARADGKATAFSAHTVGDKVLVAVHCPRGTCLVEVDAAEWDPIRWLESQQFDVPAPVKKLADEVRRGYWSRAAQERRARLASVAAEVSAEKPVAKTTKRRP